MFGLFKKKTNAFEIDARSKDVALQTAAVLSMTMMLCKSVSEFRSKLLSDKVRGYLIGFLDGAAQAARLNLPTDEQFLTYVVIAHVALLEKDVPDPPSFALDSMMLQGKRQFD